MIVLYQNRALAAACNRLVVVDAVIDHGIPLTPFQLPPNARPLTFWGVFWAAFWAVFIPAFILVFILPPPPASVVASAPHRLDKDATPLMTSVASPTQTCRMKSLRRYSLSGSSCTSFPHARSIPFPCEPRKRNLQPDAARGSSEQFTALLSTPCSPPNYRTPMLCKIGSTTVTPSSARPKRNPHPLFVLGGSAAFPSPRKLGIGNSWFVLIGERAKRANSKASTDLHGQIVRWLCSSVV